MADDICKFAEPDSDEMFTFHIGLACGMVQAFEYCLQLFEDSLTTETFNRVVCDLVEHQLIKAKVPKQDIEDILARIYDKTVRSKGESDG